MRQTRASRFVDPRLTRLLKACEFEALEPRTVFAADPVTPDNPFWAIPRGTAAIDGDLGDADWNNAFEAFRTQATRADRAVSVRMMWNDNGIFLGVVAEDFNIYADGSGAGAGVVGEVESDDSVVFYFDADGTRDLVFNANDRAFGVNLGAQNGPVNGAGAVTRAKFVRGTGEVAFTPNVNADGSLFPGTSYASTIDGTVNNASDTDRGWTIEIFLPWGAINANGAPQHGRTMSMNFEVIQDNDGGVRNLTDNRNGSNRFTLPAYVDDYVVGSHSSYRSSQPGIQGPVNYAEVMFVDSRANQVPATITDLIVDSVSPFGARLNFTAPAATVGGAGHVSGYEIRVSSGGAITNDAQWLGATRLDNTFVPRLRGLGERLRIAGLDPNTTYNIAVRAVDAAGNYGAISNVVQFATGNPGDNDFGRIIPSPNGSMLVYEKNLTPFVVVGDHLGLSWGYTRQLFPGDVWDGTQIKNYYPPNGAPEGDVEAYFDQLQATGVNAMRVYLEIQNASALNTPSPPYGTYWLEDSSGVYNPAMRTFVENVLREASERNIKLIFSPFDASAYDDAFNIEGPWGSGQGGPLDGVDPNGDAPSDTGIDRFFQEGVTLQIAKNRMNALINWVNSTPYSQTLLGWEPLSGWDSFEWTLNVEGNSDAGRETEMRRRAAWIDELARFIKDTDPNHLLLNSMSTLDPRGPLAREAFYSRVWDALTPQLTTNANGEPINNPATDKSVMPAAENAQLTNYWLTNRIDKRPVLNGQWGMTRADWPGGIPQYSDAFTQAQDEAIFRTMMWSSLAGGQAGMGLRFVTDELASGYNLLTPTMRALQRTFANVVNSTSLPIDWGNFDLRSLAGRLSATAAGRTLLSWGVSDGAQGLVYILQDGNHSTGTVSGGSLVIRGLKRNQIIDVEVWSTDAGTTAPLSTLTGLFAGDGTLALGLPDFGADVVVKFKARPAAGFTQSMVSIPVGSFVVTFALGIDHQPYAIIYDAAGNQIGRQEVATAANFRGRVVDMTPLNTADGMTHLALTDEESNLWLVSGNVGQGTWSVVNLTALIDAPGLTGDLTSYQPSWGAIHLAGLDARGHAINYWIVPGNPATPTWQFSDLTELVDGPVMTGNLTGYVASWDGLNLAGVNENNELIVYWWAPGLEGDRWQTINMTVAFDGPTLRGQLDAYVTPWGGLNVAGVDEHGETYTYWWAPGLPDDPNRWRVSNISAIASEAAGFHVSEFRENVDVAVSTDGGINIFMICFSQNLHILRWTPADQVWRWNVVTFASGYSPGGDPNPIPVTGPIASGSAANRLSAIVRGGAGLVEPILFSMELPNGEWEDRPTGFIADVTRQPTL